MKALADLTSWESRKLDLPSIAGMWPFNPSIARTPEGGLVASVRYANYHLPGSKAQPTRDQAGPVRNRVMLAWLDPSSLNVVGTREVEVPSEVAQQWNPALGLEDLRLVYRYTDPSNTVEPGSTSSTANRRAILCATASAMRAVAVETGGHAQRANRGRLEPGVLEIVALELNDFQIAKITPMRGPWSTGHQKNWSPFALGPEHPLQARAPFCLYSPLGGGVHCVGDHGTSARVFEPHDPPTLASLGESGATSRVAHASSFRAGAINVQIRGNVHARVAPERLALRGGTQLLPWHDGWGPWDGERKREPGSRDNVPRSTWIGLAHGCEVGLEKFYWHRFYEVDSTGALVGLSQPFKLSPAHGIEFAAGMARVDDYLVVSYGVEDDSAWVGTIAAADAHALIRPINARSR